MSTILNFLSRGHQKDTAEGTGSPAVSGCSIGASSVGVRTPNGALSLSWAQNMVLLQPCSLGLVRIFSRPFQHRNQWSKVSCPPTSTLTPSTSPCAQPACGQRVHTMLPLLLQVSHPPYAACLCPEDPQLHTSPLHTHTTDC